MSEMPTAERAALQSSLRPALVLDERVGRSLLREADSADVTRGGRFSAGPAGIQVWSKAWDGALGTHGSSQHLGSIDWTYDTPSKHYITIYRTMVTRHGVAAGETTETILLKVLALANVSNDGTHLSMPEPPAHDPFKR